MSESKCPRTYYGYQSGITGFCYLVWHSEANDCDVPAPEGDYVRESDYDELRAERDKLQQEQRTMLIECAKLTAERDLLRDELAQCGGYDDYADMIAQREGGTDAEHR